MTINQRVRAVREDKGLSMEQFGSEIGLSRSGISAIEYASRKVTDKHIKLICSAFGVSENWLRTGEGEMYEPTDGSLLEELAREHNLDPVEKAIISEFLDLPHEYRMIAKKIILGMAARIQQAEDPANYVITEADLDEIIARGIPDSMAQ